MRHIFARPTSEKHQVRHLAPLPTLGRLAAALALPCVLVAAWLASDPPRLVDGVNGERLCAAGGGSGAGRALSAALLATLLLALVVALRLSFAARDLHARVGEWQQSCTALCVLGGVALLVLPAWSDAQSASTRQQLLEAEAHLRRMAASNRGLHVMRESGGVISRPAPSLASVAQALLLAGGATLALIFAPRLARLATSRRGSSLLGQPAACELEFLLPGLKVPPPLHAARVHSTGSRPLAIPSLARNDALPKVPLPLSLRPPRATAEAHLAEKFPHYSAQQRRHAPDRNPGTPAFAKRAPARGSTCRL